MYLQPIEIFGIITIIPLFIYSGFLFSLKKEDRLSHIFLGLFLLTMALYTLNYILVSLKRYIPFDLEYISLHGRSLSFLLGPFLYFYVKSRYLKTLTFNFWFAVHFIPFLFSIFYYLVFYKIYELAFYSFKYLQLTIYVPFIIFALLKSKNELLENYSLNEKLYLRRLWIILLLFILLLSIDLIFFAHSAEAITLSDSLIKILTYLSMSFTFILPYYVIYDYTRNPELIKKNNFKIGSQKYEYSTLSKQESKLYGEKVLKLLEEKKLYLNGKVSLDNLAKEINISSRLLSQVINESLNKSFTELINYYRIEEAKKMLLMSGNKTILEILLSVGFNSKSAFNTAFKKHTGLTPTKYKESK